MAKFNKDALKDAARGRWVELLSSLGGIDKSLLDANHHPCPRCGGTDRFRAFDDVNDTGGLLCNQCGTFGDGIGSLGWLTGKGFQEVMALLAERLGVKAQKPAREVKPPDHSLTWSDWNATLAAQFRGRKPGITEEAMLLCGARMAMHRTHAVIAWPAIGESLSLDAPVNYVAMSCLGQPLPTVKGETVQKKVVGGKATGLLGLHGVERLLMPGMVEVVWKVEGVTDLNALQGAIPPEYRDRHVVVSNLFGCGEKPRWMAAVLAKASKVFILHDADRDGDGGAVQWAREVAQVKKEGATVVRLPYDIAPSHGKDVRDWLLEGNSYGALMDLAGQGEVIVVKRTDDGDRASNEQIDTAMERQICRALQIEVLGETAEGKIKIFSEFHHKTKLIANIARMTYTDLVQLCGPIAKEKVHKANEDIDGSYRFTDVIDAISLIAGYRQLEGGVERGAGVWLGQESGAETQTIILVNSRDAARWNGDKVLRRVRSPRVDGLLLDMSEPSPWYDLKVLGNYLKSAQDGTAFGEKAVEETVEVFGRWRWKHQEKDPLLMAGLVMASWVQSIWHFRPLVSITGESNSGKTMLLQCLMGDGDGRGLFGRLGLPVAKPTEAGLRQALGNSSKIVAIDEFEKSRDRDSVLELMRTATRGTQVPRGSVGGKVNMFGLKHIVWVAATETGAVRQPDRNRFISFELLPAAAGSKNKLRLPGGAELVALGQRLLATAIVHGQQARSLADELKQVPVPIDARVVECYAVPAAILATAAGLQGEAAKQVLVDLLETVDLDVHEQSDTTDLLGDIFAGQVNCGGGTGVLSVARLLIKSEHVGTTDRSMYRDPLERVGVVVVERKDGRGRSLFLSPRLIRNGLFRHDDQWKGVDLRTILLRLPGAEVGVAKIAGQVIRGIFLDESYLPVEESALGY